MYKRQGAGFLNVSDQLRAERRERQKQKQALAMKAAELAMQDLSLIHI